tara:strand:+ start:11347 stop:12021 length:675 start_codon:yes stop_codon:yes gene_type:complete
MNTDIVKEIVLPSSDLTGIDPWCELGRDTCNVRRMLEQIQILISNKFGKTSKYATCFNSSLSSWLSNLQGNLDALLQWSFKDGSDETKRFEDHVMDTDGENICYIDELETQDFCYLQLRKHRLYKHDVFYKTASTNLLLRQSEIREERPYPKKITSYHKHYINEFIKFINKYLESLEYILGNMTKPRYCEIVNFNIKIKELKKIVLKLKEWSPKLSVLDEIETL